MWLQGGDTIEEAFEQQVVAMFGYMTEIDKVCVDEAMTQEFEVTGHDIDSILYCRIPLLSVVVVQLFILLHVSSRI